MRIGVDAGGTFTDFVILHEDGHLEAWKLRSNPAAPAQVILEGLRRATGRKRAEVVHGSTVATNALLERKGARTAFITTAGFEDLAAIGRQNREQLYNLTPDLKVPLVPRERCFGVRERAYYDGVIAKTPSQREMMALRKRLFRMRVDSIAICFLHAYQTPGNERIVEEALRGVGFVCRSSEVCPEFREYERASTTLINAYVGPLMDRYLGELERLSPHRISIMQSNGGSLPARDARRHAVRTILSGPAGGVTGASETARLSGYSKILGFDMGGTSTDVSLCEGAPRESVESSVDGFPIRIPMLDIHTVGAGGGSLARVDAGGLLRVGPESAGADPGPACYGAGDEPTVTDAHVVLGRIAVDQLAAGALRLDAGRAALALDRVAKPLGMDRVRAAEGILRVANANMERAIRVVSVERGHDPRDFALVAFGGCGGLHACELAAQLGLRTVLVPAFAGVLSALGLLWADTVRDFAIGALSHETLDPLFRSLERRARRELPGASLERSADLRYVGQSYELNVPWRGDGASAFHREHQRVYGYSDEKRPIEIVTVRVRARRTTPKPALVRESNAGQAPAMERRVFVDGRWRRVRVYARSQVSRAIADGPALVADYGATTLIPPGWQFHQDDHGMLIIRRTSFRRKS
ncbi:MAG TPA: hydantoinase/oxoprolinase family protein [Bryobacteraceae bacterium]|jgi:N-methylhydantoinase A|nr:hydantoinase/oxoprolinase family protein [Bryobacteraceae bacterium]